MGNVLPPDRLGELIARVRAGDEGARDLIASSNLRLVMSLVQRFQGRGIDLEELFQVGCVGLMKAIDKFDSSYGVQFSTYAVPVILGEIKRYLRDNGAIKVSRTTRELASCAARVRQELAASLGREPTIDEIASTLEVSREEIVESIEAMRPVIHIFDVVSDDGEDEDLRVIDQIRAGEDFDTRSVELLALRDALAKLDEIERNVILMRYFRDMNQVDVAQVLGISQAQVSRLEKRALKRMRDCMAI
ncbi:MAG TPA: SigB/SigF/SigG family RNA polymerase sigma factor [Firmicutes bacterium]|nr:SigB/SigF/SigG family RNA polymerase sigma factor [Bacillota bacterium]